MQFRLSTVNIQFFLNIYGVKSKLHGDFWSVFLWFFPVILTVPQYLGVVGCTCSKTKWELFFKTNQVSSVEKEHLGYVKISYSTDVCPMWHNQKTNFFELRNFPLTWNSFKPMFCVITSLKRTKFKGLLSDLTRAEFGMKYLLRGRVCKNIVWNIFTIDSRAVR